MKVVIIIPTYNEKGNIEKLITILENEIFPKIKNHSMSILVADDNSPDKTADEVKKLMAKWNNIDISDRKSTRLNSSHQIISYAVFCLKKKKNNTTLPHTLL